MMSYQPEDCSNVVVMGVSDNDDVNAAPLQEIAFGQVSRIYLSGSGKSDAAVVNE